MQTVVIIYGRFESTSEVDEFGTVHVGGLSQSLLIFLMQLSHQQQLSVQLVHLQMAQCRRTTF